MILRNTNELQKYINRCFNNIATDYKNDFLGLEISPEDECAIKLEMKEAGFHEFLLEKTDWPSLYLSVDSFKNSNYHKNIHFDKINEGNIAFEKKIIPANQLFNVEAIINDPHKELNDSMTLRALDKPYETSALTIDGDTWMMDIYSEAFTIDPFAEKAKGNVVTLGLGIGYFVYMAMLNPKVESITVVEINSTIISLFKKYIQPQFPKTIPLTIIEANAKTWFTKENVDKFDYVFVDTYQSSDDGYEMMQDMLKSYVPPLEKVDFWIEDSCVEFLRTLIVIFFSQYINKQEIYHQDPYYNEIMKKIAQYFDKDIIIDGEDDLKNILYDCLTLREIIGTKVDNAKSFL